MCQRYFFPEDKEYYLIKKKGEVCCDSFDLCSELWTEYLAEDGLKYCLATYRIQYVVLLNSSLDLYHESLYINVLLFITVVKYLSLYSMKKYFCS